MITIIPIKPEAIEEYWERIRPFIESARKFTVGEYNIFNVYERIKAGAILPLIVYDGEEIIAVLTLEIIETPLKKVVNVMTAGGERMNEWLPDAVKHVDELAKEIGADIISIHGRRGWLKTLAKHNYKDTYTVLTKEVNNMSGSLGGGQSSSTQNPDQVWGAQSPYLQQMYGNASTAAMDPSGQQYAQGYQDPAMQAFQQQAGGGFQQGDISGLNKMASGANQNLALGGAIDAGLNQINNNFNRNIMPGISSGAVGAGQSGSSRQGIAEGLAASDANQQASDFVNQMQSGNFANILQSQGQAQGQLSQNMNVNQQAQNQAMQGAMGQAPTLANLGFGSQFGSLNNMAGIIGGPTVLGQGGESDSWNASISGGLT